MHANLSRSSLEAAQLRQLCLQDLRLGRPDKQRLSEAARQLLVMGAGEGAETCI